MHFARTFLIRRPIQEIQGDRLYAHFLPSLFFLKTKLKWWRNTVFSTKEWLRLNKCQWVVYRRFSLLLLPISLPHNNNKVREPCHFLSQWTEVLHWWQSASIYAIYQCCGSGMFITDPGSEFFHPGSRVKKAPDPRIRNTGFKYF